MRLKTIFFAAVAAAGLASEAPASICTAIRTPACGRAAIGRAVLLRLVLRSDRRPRRTCSRWRLGRNC